METRVERWADDRQRVREIGRQGEMGREGEGGVIKGKIEIAGKRWRKEER